MAVAASSEPGGADPASGFFWSIIFMIASVLTLGGAVVFFIARAIRRADAAQARFEAGSEPAAA